MIQAISISRSFRKSTLLPAYPLMSRSTKPTPPFELRLNNLKIMSIPYVKPFRLYLFLLFLLPNSRRRCSHIVKRHELASISCRMPCIEIAPKSVHPVLRVVVAPRSSLLAIAAPFLVEGAHDLRMDDVDGVVGIVWVYGWDTETLRCAFRDDGLLLAIRSCFVSAFFDHVIPVRAGVEVALLIFAMSICALASGRVAFATAGWSLTSAVTLMLSFCSIPLPHTARLVPFSLGRARESRSGGKDRKGSCEDSCELHVAG